MSPTVLATRAITSIYAQTLLWPLLIVGVIVYVVVLALVGWIAYAASPWWWLLAVVPTFVLLIGLTLWIVAFLFAKRLEPPMNKRQRKAAKRFVGLIGTVAEQLGTPRFILIFRVIKDVVMPPAQGRTFIGELTETPGKIRREFEDLRQSFN